MRQQHRQQQECRRNTLNDIEAAEDEQLSVPEEDEEEDFEEAQNGVADPPSKYARQS